MSRTVALECVRTGIDAADPERAVRERVRLDGERLFVADDARGNRDTSRGDYDTLGDCQGVAERDYDPPGGSQGTTGRDYDLSLFDHITIAGGGKAAAAVARGLESVLGNRIDGGVVVTDSDTTTERIEVIVGDHPVPSERSVEGTERVMSMLERAGERTLVLAPITGGASALLVSPVDGVTLDDLQATTNGLLESGAPIDAVNTVRKHLSTVKGGGLARLTDPATVIALLVSDVVGDDPSIIASGPVTPDETTCEDALSMLERYEVDAPDSIQTHLERGRAEEAAETPTIDDGFAHVHPHLLVTNRTALMAAAEEARDHGYQPFVLSSSMRGEAREIALSHTAIAEEVHTAREPAEPPAAILSGGEVTVTVTGDGTGGPNTELALAAAVELPESVTLISVDTDGRDGGTDAAGAVVDATTVDDQMAAQEALANNDAYPYLASRDALVRLDSTTNVNDLRVLLVDPSDAD